MNSSKISLQSQQFVTAYIWFIHLTSFLSWITFPFLFYIILTQSQGLKNYKRFILNHSFWSLMFETVIGLFTPMPLLPVFGGFPLTILREAGSMHFTSTATFIGFLFISNYTASLYITIATRYVATFSKSQKYTQKIIIILALLCCTIMYPLIIYGAIMVYAIDSNIIHKNAESFDEYFIDFKEPSMIFFLIKPYKAVLIAALIILIITFIAGIVTNIVFIYLVRSNKSASVTNVQRTLITSSVVQILLTLLFFILPVVIILIIVIFEVPHSSAYGCICISFISAHSFLEFIATLYFVLPYRKFIQKQLTKFSTAKTIAVVPVHQDNSFIPATSVLS